MLGNWSFGDYFKEGAIDMAWECLIKEFGLDEKRIYATYFGGDDQSPADEEARKLWLKYLPAERVLPFDAKDNFWEMGAVGPCGPCVEIHYDRIGNRDAAALVNADLPDVIEIWNNVFIQYNREADGSLRSLPAQHIDTGMGFERLTSILQGKDSNYDTDIFSPIFEAIQKVTGAKPYAGKVGADDIGFVDMAYRVVADHIRTLTFAIADGAVPDNDGRGYVLRRILRRAVRYGRQNLGAELGFFAKLVPVVTKLMGDTFPEILENEENITAIIKNEEESFSRTVDKGVIKFNELAETVQAKNQTVFPGEDAHFLYTSMGFPVDLIELMAEEKGMTLDMEGYDRKMQEEKELSAAAHKAKMSGGSGKDMTLQAEQTYCLVGKNIEKTNDEAKYVWNDDLQDCVAKALFLGRNETEDNIGFVDEISEESGTVGIILDKTGYYAEQGGQIFDTGLIKSQSSGAVLTVENVQLYGGYVLHVGTVTGGSIKSGDLLTCSVDYKRRAPIASNHTMTHVLNYALRDTLVSKNDKNKGATVDQRGSLVDETKLRFDFTWDGALSVKQLETVEKVVMDQISAKLPIQAEKASLEAAQKISSLRAVFGEEYPDPVRVVAVAPSSISEILANPDDSKWNDYSVEFCGGTHITNTSEAQSFVLLQEEGIAKGIRRITGVTMDGAAEATARADEFEAKVVAAKKMEGSSLEAELKLLTEELKGLSISAVRKDQMRSALSDLTKQVMAWKKKHVQELTTKAVEAVLSAATPSDSNKVVCRFDFGVDGKVAKSIMTSYGKKIKDKAFLLVSSSEDKFMVIAFAPKGMQGVDCKAWINAATEGTGGKGGGKKDSAQFTVSGIDKIEGVLEKAKAF